MSSPDKLTPIQWLVCVIAAIGFAFDIYELLMLPLILGPALQELLGAAPGSEAFNQWRGLLFFIPAFVGGIFGLLGGYLTDRLGRRRVLTWSILLYAFSAFAAGFSTNIWMLLVLRCTTFVGVCVEFVAAVAWLAELFPEHERRERVLGYTQAFSSIGGLLVAFANHLAIDWSTSLPAIQTPGFLASLGEIAGTHAPWRYTLMSGLIPAIPLIIIRPFLPESPSWAKKKASGTLKRPSIRELFSPELRKTTIVTTLMFAMSYGAAFGAIQQMPQIAPGMPDVQAQVAAALAAKFTKEQQDELRAKLTAAGKKPEEIAKAMKIEENKVANPVRQLAASNYTKVQEVGGLFGRFLLALLVVRIVSRRQLLRLFQVPGLILMPIVFGYAAINNRELFSMGDSHVTLFHVGIFLAGLVTVAQFSFWGNYLPRVYPVHLRGTGESFAANIGGRMFGTSFAWITSTLAATSLVPGTGDPMKMAYAAAGVAFFVYLVGLVASCWLPEPSIDALPD